MWGRWDELNGLTIQAEPDTEDKGRSLEDESVQMEDFSEWSTCRRDREISES